MLEISYPCTCGHSRINHDLPFGLADRGSIKVIYVCGVNGCSCDEFIADNLKYLEKKSGSKQ